MGEPKPTDLTDNYTYDLNPQQAEAVLHTDGPMLVVAGAGSGKTMVVTRRIARLIGEGLAEPESILAVTFTNKASQEMRDRVAKQVGKEAADRVMLSTFHSFCLKVLRKHIQLLGYRSNFTISGEGDMQTLVRRVLEDLDGINESFSPAIFRESISLMKGRDEEPTDDDPENAEDKYGLYLAEVYNRYDSALRAANALDFDDLLRLVVRLFREHPEVLEAFRKQYRYVMVDEYQDTNGIQYGLVRMLVDGHQNICVVGDDDQSIYGWRGADLQNILRFEKDFRKAKIVRLTRNYRSTKTILDAANAVIANNTQRRPKAMEADGGQGRPIDWHVVGDEEHEAKVAADWLEHIRTNSGAAYSDFGILYRSNTQARPFEIVFRQANIPYVVIGGQEFFDRAEVRDIIAYLKLLMNPRDESSFLRVVNVPRRGIGDVTLHAIHDLCREKKLTFGKAMAEGLKTGVIHGQAEKGVRSLLGLFSSYREQLREGTLSLKEIVENYISDTGYYEEIERIAKTPQQALFRRENVQAVVNAVSDYADRTETPTLRGFLDESMLNSDADRGSKNDRRANAVTLMTIHSAKGLEFPFVFIVGAEESLLPHERSIRDNTIEEERRLFYVAVTRGRRHVTIFEALSRNRHGKDRLTTTSRFVKEIPSELVKHRIHAARDMVEARIGEDPKPHKSTRARKPRQSSSK